MPDRHTHPSETKKVKTPCGNAYVILIFDKGISKIEKVECHLGKGGGCASGHIQSLSKDMDAVLSKESIGDRLPYYTEKTGMTCQEGYSCIGIITRVIMNKDIYLNSKEVN